MWRSSLRYDCTSGQWAGQSFAASQDLPVQIAFCIQPRCVEPGQATELLQLFVVAFDIWLAIIGNRPCRVSHCIYTPQDDKLTSMSYHAASRTLKQQVLLQLACHRFVFPHPLSRQLSGGHHQLLVSEVI